MTENNKVTIRGEILDNPILDREFQGKRYYSTKISIKRYSGVKDIIPLVIPEKNIEVVRKGRFVEVTGEFNSSSVFGKDGKQHLKLFLFVNNIKCYGEISTLNEIYLKGIIDKPPVKRITPLGREITDFIVVSKRWNEVTDCIPCIAWNVYAEYAEKLKEGTEVELYGRLQSREYIKKFSGGEETRVAYEVSVTFLSAII